MYLKRWWNRKEGSGNKDFKNGREGGGGKLGQPVGALKRGTGLEPLYELCNTQVFTNCEHGYACVHANGIMGTRKFVDGIDSSV